MIAEDPITLTLGQGRRNRSCMPAQLPSSVQLFATLWTVTHHVLLSKGFPRQEYWSELPFPLLGDLPDPGIEPSSPALASRFFTTQPPGKPGTDLR